MGRPLKLLSSASDDPTPTELVSSVSYNAAGQTTSMSGSPGNQTWSYNALGQLTRQTASQMEFEYRYSATQNDGWITQRKDWVSGEEITYQYDSLKRLISAVTTGPEWGLSFGYDGFGNLLNQSVTKGQAPSLSVNVNPATNRITGSGYGYDSNGNLTSMPNLAMSYDVENRLVEATRDYNGTIRYVYDPFGRRVWEPWNGNGGKVSFYGADGALLGSYYYYGDQYWPPPWVFRKDAGEINIHFAGRLIRGESSFGDPYTPWGGGWVYPDRLGSTVKHFPYGEEYTTTAQNRVKFGTYYRDQVTALDYAQHRYYSSSIARFTTPDPYRASGGPADPQSWNRYAYVQNDPVNFNDRHGLLKENAEGPSFCAVYPDGPGCSPYPHYLGGIALLMPAVPDIDQLSYVPGVIPQGIGAAFNALGTIRGAGFESKTKCKDFFSELIKENNLDTDVDDLMAQVASMAGDAYSHGYVYDGPSSTTALSADKFPGVASPGVGTVGAWFSANSGAQALSQFNGSTIWIRADDWAPSLGGLVGSMYDGEYGLGTMMHELLHKVMVGGGFIHDQLGDALDAIGLGPGDYSLGHNRISEQLGRICF